jgi:hypothetical protein
MPGTYTVDFILDNSATAPRPRITNKSGHSHIPPEDLHPNQNALAQASLREWLTETRRAIDKLVALARRDRVSHIFYMVGCPVYVTASLSIGEQANWNISKLADGSGWVPADLAHAKVLLFQGWAADILTTGTYDGPNGSLDYLQLGQWQPVRTSFNSVHNIICTSR